jgi:hypothetical protein
MALAFDLVLPLDGAEFLHRKIVSSDFMVRAGT